MEGELGGSDGEESVPGVQEETFLGAFGDCVDGEETAVEFGGVGVGF